MALVFTEVTPTVAAAAYAARDHVGDVLSFTSAVGSSGGAGVIVSAEAIFSTAVTAQLDLIPFSATPSGVGADNAAITWDDAASLTAHVPIKLPAAEVTALNAYAAATGYWPFKCAATTLFIVIITNNVWTPAANGVMIRLGIIPAP